MSKRQTIFVFGAAVLLIGGLLFFRYQSYHSHGDLSGGKIFEISQQRVTGFPELPAALPLLVHKTHDPVT